MSRERGGERENRVRNWWGRHPMTYGDAHGEARHDQTAAQPGSPEFFHNVDRVFYAWNAPLHGQRPFSRLFPYERYRDAEQGVLEIGCGLGAMAMNWAQAGVTVTGVDLNAPSVALSRRRFQRLGLAGRFLEADARALPFADGQFDYVYSWGVLHHSPDIQHSLAEMMRVLRPGGGFGLMLYNRRSILHGYMTRYLEGFLHRESRFLEPLALASRYGDGGREEGNPHTWPMTRAECLTALHPFSGDVACRQLGTELDSIFKYLAPGLGLIMPRWMKKPWARRFGWSLWLSGHKD